MMIKKRCGKKEKFNLAKIISAVEKAFDSVGTIAGEKNDFIKGLNEYTFSQCKFVEEIQDTIERLLMRDGYYSTAKSFIIYREQHKEMREIIDRAEYIEHYINSGTNAATSSEVDANANVQNKNIATLESELYKSKNTRLSRYRVTKKLRELFGNDAPNYVKDLESGLIYKHDEGSAPAIKPYCVAVNLYPFMLNGTSTLDGLKSAAPTNLSSFVGQFGNLAFLLSSQFQGAVAFGEFFNVFNYYCVKEFGNDYYKWDNTFVYETGIQHKTVKSLIIQAFQGIIYTINQPAGNRSYQSPFTNISYYDSNYWKALFEDFVYPDGTKPEWGAIDYLQRLFINWFNEERSKCLLTFPVETIALLTDGKDVIDKEYKQLTSEMYAKGHSFFTYISDNADSLASCCRLKNKLDTNTFSFTSGLTGVATGSKSVITLNINRIVQKFAADMPSDTFDSDKFQDYLVEILEDVYKYHLAYNELLWDLKEKDMMPVYTQGYIDLNKQFLTIGINGLNEAAEFLGMTCSDNIYYELFCKSVTETLYKCNRAAEKKYSTKKRVIKFNSEQVPAEGLGIKNYDNDKKDGYWVPSDRNCYTSYFFKPDDEELSVLDKFRLHGERYTDTLDGGVAAHINLEKHLSVEQYNKLIDYAIQEGTNYFTFNIRQTQCNRCGHISKNTDDKCGKCGSDDLTYWSRIIGYLRPIKCFSAGRQIEANKRIYNAEV